MTDKEIKKSITEKALNYGVPSKYSQLFDELSASFKNEFEKSIVDRNFGLPIVKYGHPNGNWIIIGTKEIAWKKDQLNFLSIDSLTVFTVPNSEKERAIHIQPDQMIRKFEYEILTLNTLEGESYNIWLNKGKEYYGFWHVIIKFFGWRNEDNTTYSKLGN